jgi:methionyl-tRNA formyltransferase
MNIVFAGTPEFAAVALDALVRAGHAVSLVLTRPDQPAGRGLKVRQSAVKRLAAGLGLSLLQPASMKDPQVAAAIAARAPEVMVVAAYGLILPRTILQIPQRGCINIHASLLPRWRGAAPIQRALLAGDPSTGVTIMQMDEGLDTGAILLQERVAIGAEDTAQTLHDRLAALGGKLIVEALAAPPSPRPQDEQLATYAPRIEKSEARIDWREPAEIIERKVRAFNPEPGAHTLLNGAVLKIWRARVEPGVCSAPGAICESGPAGIVVACGADGVRLLELQRAGSKRLPVHAFVTGLRGAHGSRMGS